MRAEVKEEISVLQAPEWEVEGVEVGDSRETTIELKRQELLRKKEELLKKEEELLWRQQELIAQERTLRQHDEKVPALAVSDQPSAGRDGGQEELRDQQAPIKEMKEESVVQPSGASERCWGVWVVAVQRPPPLQEV